MGAPSGRLSGTANAPAEEARMPEYAGYEETELEQTAVVWPEPSRLDAWWENVMASSTGGGSGAKKSGQVPPTTPKSS